MALTRARWILAFLLVCGVIVATYGAPDAPPAVRRPASLTPERDHQRRLQARLTALRARWRVASRREAAISIAANAAPHHDEPTLITDPRLPMQYRQIIERALSREWRSLGIDASRVSVALAVRIDTATIAQTIRYAGDFALSIDYVLPASSHEGCLSVVTIEGPRLLRPGGHGHLATALLPAASGPRLLGPCAFYARFGHPGTAVEQWLRGRGYDVASEPVWDAPLASWAGGLRWDGSYSTDLSRARAGPRSIDATACAGGDLPRCSATIVDDTAGPAPSGGSFVAGGTTGPHWSRATPRYLSDLAAAIGMDRFERFWRSSLPPDAALQDAAQMSIGEWTHRWAVSLDGPRLRGPGVTLPEVGVTIMLVAGCLAGAMAGLSRRQAA